MNSGKNKIDELFERFNLHIFGGGKILAMIKNLKSWTIKFGLIGITILVGLFVWRFFILKCDKISYHHNITISTDKQEYNIGDSIIISVVYKSIDGNGLVRLFDDHCNQQVYFRKAIKRRIATSGWGAIFRQPYEAKTNYLFYNWSSYHLSAGQGISTKLKGKIYKDVDHKIVFDFGIHGKCISPQFYEYAIKVNTFELFPDTVFLFDMDYFVPSSDFVFIRLNK